MKKIGSLFFCFLMMVMMPLAHAQEEGEIDKEPSVLLSHDAMAHITPLGSGAAYMILENTSETDVSLISAQSEAFDRTEIHKTAADEHGVMRMQPIEILTIPAKEKVELKRGGYHIMLMGAKEQDISAIPLILEFDKAPSMNLSVPVHTMRAMGDDPSEHHHHH